MLLAAAGIVSVSSPVDRECGVVPRGQLLAPGDELVEPVQLRQHDRGVRLAHPPVRAHARVEVRVERALALVAVDARFFGDVVVVGDDHAALTAGDDLGRVEREARRLSEGSGRAPVVRAAVRVCGVFHQVCAVRRAQLRDLVDGGRDQPADVDDHDGRGVGADAAREIDGIDRHRDRVAVDEAQPRARVNGGGRGREERVRRNDDLTTFYAERRAG